MTISPNTTAATTRPIRFQSDDAPAVTLQAGTRVRFDCNETGTRIYIQAAGRRWAIVDLVDIEPV